MKLLSCILIFFIINSIESARKCRQCRQNEVYMPCGPSCGGDGCNQIYYLVPCNNTCLSGCFCKCGYYRNEAGVCVPANQCFGGAPSNVGYARLCPGIKCLGQYEYKTEANECEQLCPGTEETTDCVDDVSPGCYCLPGFYRNPYTSACVPESECANIVPTTPKPIVCGANEIVGCKPCQSCAYEISLANGRPLACFYLCPTVPTGCICIDGYVRDSRNVCVPRAQCFTNGTIPTTVL